jgi:hypothetical protein
MQAAAGAVLQTELGAQAAAAAGGMVVLGLKMERLPQQILAEVGAAVAF